MTALHRTIISAVFILMILNIGFAEHLLLNAENQATPEP
jgi:hypothetical protein